MRTLGKPAFAELVCAGLALVCLLAPTWWMLEQGRAERLSELQTLLSGAATTSVSQLTAWSRTVGAEVQLVVNERGLVDEARTLLSAPAAGSERFVSSARAALESVESGAATRFVLTDQSGNVVAASQPGATQLEIVPPPDTAPWRSVTGRHNGSSNWPVAYSVPVIAENGAGGWLIIGVESTPAIRSGLQSIAALERVGAYAVATQYESWIERTGTLADKACAVEPADLLAVTAVSSGLTQSGVNVDGFRGCAGQGFAAWQYVPDLDLTVFVEAEAASAMKLLRVGRLTTVGMAALLGAIILILIMLQTSDVRVGAGAAKAGSPRKNTAAWGILAVSLVATAIGGVASQLRYQNQQQVELVSAGQRLSAELKNRVARYGQALKASASAYGVLDPPVGEDWVSFTKSLRLDQDFPAFACMSLFMLNPSAEQRGLPGGAHAEMVAETAPVPGGCPIGKPDEPTRKQLSLLGTRATSTNDVTAGMLHWSSRGGARDWLALVLPATQEPEGPRSGNDGWVVAFVDTSILATGLTGTAGLDLSYALYEGSVTQSSGLVFDSGGQLSARPSDQLVQNTVELGGTAWTIAASRTESASIPFDENYPFQVVLAGLAISVLLFDIALVLSSTRARAIGIAALMTERFRDSEERIRAVIDHAPDGIIAFDSVGRISTYNPGAEKLFGYTSEEVQGLRIGDLIPVCESRTVAELSAASSDIATECVGISKSGKCFPVELTISRVLQVRGPVRYSAIVRDVTARKLTEERLRESEERYALASRGANDGLWDWNLKTDEVYYSTRWKEIVGAVDDEIGDRPSEWFDRVHPDDIGALRATLDKHLKGTTNLFASEHRVRHAEGGVSLGSQPRRRGA